MIFFFFFLQTTFNFIDDIPGPVTHYNFYFSSGNNLATVTDPSCDSDDCEQYEVDVPSSACSLLANVNVTVPAANRLGQGPPSQPLYIGISINLNLRVSTQRCVLRMLVHVYVFPSPFIVTLQY